MKKLHIETYQKSQKLRMFFVETVVKLALKQERIDKGLEVNTLVILRSQRLEVTADES